MKTRTPGARAAAACLAVSSIAYLVQRIATPVAGGGKPAAQVSDAAGNLSAMKWALVFDLPLLLLVPSVLFVAILAGGTRSRLATCGGAFALLGVTAGMFMLANDVLLYEAARDGSKGAVALVTSYQENGLFLAMLLTYLLGTVVGFLLLGAGLWRSRAIPRPCALAMAIWPIAAFAPKPTDGVLLVIGALACAWAFLRNEDSAADRRDA
ncbi:MAG: hypothetical protein JWM98_2179 [Thermoleophilia bacterium]|nr:hypothetical protein [Thermoleophilia bacterium]